MFEQPLSPEAMYGHLAQQECRYEDVVGEMDKSRFAKVQESIAVLEGIESEVDIPISEDGFKMSPLEAETKVPLPIVTGATAKGAKRGSAHHAYYYQDAYRTRLEDRALLYSRMQNMGRWEHDRTHKFFDGTSCPESLHQVFNLVILNCAGYVPEFGVHMKPKEAVIRPLRASEKAVLRKHDTFMTERYNNGMGAQRHSIGVFIMCYAVSQNLDIIRTKEVEEFLSLTPENIEAAPNSLQDSLRKRKQKLAETLTGIAIDASVDSVRSDFTKAQQSSLLKRTIVSIDPSYVMQEQLEESMSEYHDALEGFLLEGSKVAA